jgi:hypothetical protein
VRIAVGGLPSGPHAVVFMGAPNLSYSPFSSRSPAGTQEDAKPTAVGARQVGITPWRYRALKQP